MKLHCNPLLKSWNKHLKQADQFAVLRRYGCAVIASERRVVRIKKKARR